MASGLRMCWGPMISYCLTNHIYFWGECSSLEICQLLLLCPRCYLLLRAIHLRGFSLRKSMSSIFSSFSLMLFHSFHRFTRSSLYYSLAPSQSSLIFFCRFALYSYISGTCIYIYIQITECSSSESSTSFYTILLPSGLISLFLYFLPLIQVLFHLILI